MKEEIYINLSGIYDGFPSELNCKDINGTNCYCDDYAKERLRKRLQDVSLERVHFIDSGNYHYLSYFFLERIQEDFALVLLDHHPDYQPPSFGDILSCGGWVKNAFEEFEHLKKVYMVDVDEDLFYQLKDVPPEICLLKKDELEKISADLPIYVSLDKDVLSEDEAATDWDQGDMKISELLDIMSVLQEHRLLGVDVCGEKKEAPTDSEIEINRKINETINETIYNCFDNSI